MGVARAGGTSPDESQCSGNPPAAFVSMPEFLSNEEILGRLSHEGFADAMSADALYVMSRVGYQHFKPYLRVVSELGIASGPSVKVAHDVLTFDRRMQSIIFKYVGIFEARLRAQYAEKMAEAYGGSALYEPSLFMRDDNYRKTMSVFEAEINKKARRGSQISSMLARYGGRVPVWVGVESMTLGTLCHFYDNTSDRSVTGSIAESFGTTKAVLSNWSRTITQVRNICAHFEPYIIRREIPATPKAIRGQECPPRSTLFIFVLLAWLIGDQSRIHSDRNLNYSKRIRQDAAEMIFEFERYCGGLIPIAGFPAGRWKEYLGVTQLTWETRKINPKNAGLM